MTTAPISLEDMQARFFERLSALGIETQTHRHPPLFTVEQSKKYRGTIPGSHCKNLFLKDKKGVFWLVVAQEDTQINLKTLPKVIGSHRLSFGKPDLLHEILGILPGSVTPYALINDEKCLMQVILDKKMMTAELVNFHPMSNDATTSISPNDLVKFIESCGHKPHIHEIG